MDKTTTVSTFVPAILDGTFFKIIGGGSEKTKIKAECVTCKSQGKNVLISGSLTTTSNFKLHMKRKHEKLLPEYENYKAKEKQGKKQKSTTTGVPLKQTKLNFQNKTKLSQLARQNQLNDNVMNYIINSMKPLSTVDDTYFRKIISDLDPEINMMSRRTLGRKIDDLYLNTCEKIKQKIGEISHVSTTADIWSTKHRSFMGVTAHWIDPETFERVSCVLSCRRFKGTHSYDKIAELLYDINSEYKINDEKLVSTITDNGSNFVKAFKEFGFVYDENTNEDQDSDSAQEMTLASQFDLNFEQLGPEEENRDEGEPNGSSSTEHTDLHLPRHLRCASHTLSLLGTTDFKKVLASSPSVCRIHHTALAKCTVLWNLSRKPKSSEIIKDHLGSQLLYPVPTRWNSLYDSVDGLLKFKEQLNPLFVKLNLTTAFKEIELEYLHEFTVILKPVAVALDHLQSEQHCYYGQLVPTLFSLKSRLLSLKEKNLRHTGKMVGDLVEFLNKRFKDFFDLSPQVNEAVLAACFHPKFKLRWLPETAGDFERQRIQNMCINSLESNFTSQLQAQVKMETDEVAGSSEDDDFYVLSSSKEKPQNHFEVEVMTYLNDSNKTLTSLNQYTNIKTMFKRYNTSLCSSAPVERLFSFANFILSPTRGSMSDSAFEKLVVLKGNQDL